MDTIHDKVTRTFVPQVGFDWTPKAGPFTLTFGGNIYPWGENQPQAGAPDQADIFYTHTGVELTFTATVTPAPGDFIIAYHWDFGDGTEGFGPVVQHTYRVPSPQTRTSLCVTDNHRRTTCVGRQMLLQSASPIVVSQAIRVEPS